MKKLIPKHLLGNKFPYYQSNYNSGPLAYWSSIVNGTLTLNFIPTKTIEYISHKYPFSDDLDRPDVVISGRLIILRHPWQRPDTSYWIGMPPYAYGEFDENWVKLLNLKTAKQKFIDDLSHTNRTYYTSIKHADSNQDLKDAKKDYKKQKR